MGYMALKQIFYFVSETYLRKNIITGSIVVTNFVSML